MIKRLRRPNICCQAATTAAETIDLVRGCDFDGVLLDMCLPDMDGNTALREMKRIKPDIRVVILTGRVSVVMGQVGMKESAADYLLKPVEFETLVSKLLTGKGQQARGSPDTS